jgi:beta-glucosidase
VSHLAELVKSGRVDVKLVDDAVRRVLRVKFALGLFDDPFRYSDAAREKAATLTPENLAAARDVARRSIVLLKNAGAMLPLRKDIASIAVIGPLANDKDSPLGNWRGQGTADSAVSLLEGVKAAVSPATRVVHAEGAKLVTGPRNFMTPSAINTTDRSGFPAAVQAARDADVVLLAIGETAYQSGEGRSVADLRLAGLQDELAKAVLEANKNVVVVLMSGRPLAIGHVAEAVPALVQAWHLGSEAGNAIADVLFGDYNPSGKLPVSFPRHVGQMPLYYSHKNTGRPGPEAGVTWSHFNDVANEALFLFGFGLGYTTFTYSDVKLSATEIPMSGKVQATVTVTNSGSRAGAEVVQLYLRDRVGSVTRPVKELKGFEKVELRPGESREVTFTLSAADLAFYTARCKWEAEPGVFDVFIGGNSKDLKAASFTLR